MEPADSDRLAHPEAAEASPERLDALRMRCRIDHDQLVRLASFADTLVDAARLVDEARAHADRLVEAAEHDAERIRADAARAAEQAAEEARRQLQTLEADIARLEAERARAESAMSEARGRLSPADVALAEFASALPPVAQAFSPTLPPVGQDFSPALQSESIDRDVVAVFPVAHRVRITLSSEKPNDGGGSPDVGAPAHSMAPAVSPAAHSDAHDFSPATLRKLLNVGESPEVDSGGPSPESPSSHRVGPWRPALAVAALAVIVVAGAAWLLRAPAAFRAAGSDPVAVPAAPAPPAARLASEPAAEAAPPPADQPVRVSVVVRAARKAWLRLSVDGAMQPGSFIAAGERRELTGDREVEVRTADAGALLVSVNGAPEAPLGLNGRELTRRWTPEISDPPASVPAETMSARQDAARGPKTPGVAEPVQTVATAGVADAPPAAGTSVRQQILDGDRRWFDALYRGDEQVRRALQSAEFELNDQRSAADRPPSGVAVDRTLRSVQVDTWGDGAVASGVMTERHPTNGREIESIFSETWVRRGDRWQMLGLRIARPGQAGTPAKP